MHLLDRVVSADTASTLAMDRVTLCAIGYLALPNLIFLAGWFRWAAAIPLVVLIGAGIIRFGGRVMDYATAPDPYKPLFLVVIALVWASLGGAGHFFYANPDWLVRDAVLGDLVFGAWPVAYPDHDGPTLVLRSAIGYFLPAALVGKIIGIGAVDLALYLWTVLGAAIFLLLLPLPRRPYWLLGLCLIVVVLFSGMDILGIVINHKTLPVFPMRIEWWVPYSYTSISGQILWAPNHALPIWLLTALFFRHWAHKDFSALAVVTLPLSLIWTPFAAIAMAPFIVLAALRCWTQRTPLRIHPVQLVGAVLMVYLVGSFLTMDIGRLPSYGVASPGPIGPTVSLGRPANFADYFLFVEMEFGVLALAMLPLLRHSYGVFGVSVIALLLLPIYGIGPSNDSMLRLSIAPLLLMMILVLRSLQVCHAESRWPASAWIVGVILLLGVPTPFFEMSRAVLWPRVAPDYSKTLIETQEGALPPHYVARLNQSDLQWFMNSPKLVPPSEVRLKN